MQNFSEIAAWSITLKGDVTGLDQEREPFIINLPLFSPNILNPRFRIEDGVIPVIVRSAFYRLKKSVLDVRRIKPLYLHGPRGVGKSYILYLFAAELAIRQRTDLTSYRVTYVNDCGAWISDPNKYFLNELIATFAADDRDLHLMSKVSAIVSKFDEQSRQLQISALLNDLLAFVKKNDLRWFVIFDQLNAFQTGKALSVSAEFAWNIVKYLATFRSPRLTVLGSATASNEASPIELYTWESHSVDLVPYSYEESEFQLWCQNSNLQPSDDKITEVRHYTGGIPLELEFFNSIHATSFSEKLKAYKLARLQELILSHRKFCNSLTQQDLKNLKDCIGRLALGLSPPANLCGIDRQLLVIDKDKASSEQRIVALFPLARSAVMLYNCDIIQESLKMVADIVFIDQVNYPNDVKGRVVGRYIITSLEEKRQFDFFGQMFRFQGEIQKVVYFDGDFLPIRGTISKSECSLIVPTSSRYPDMDFFIWNPAAKEKVLLAVQVTVQKSLKDHMKNCKFMWLNWCRFFQISRRCIHSLWIAPEECIDADLEVDNGLNNYFLKFNALGDLCPIIHKFKRAYKENISCKKAYINSEDSSIDSQDEVLSQGSTIDFFLL